MIFKERTKSIPITKEMVWAAYKQVRSNGGSAGVDNMSLSDLEQNRSKLLYKLWNRLSSGSYFPSAVKRVEIPKDGGKVRLLGIPTVMDRIAQEVLKSYLEPRLEREFLDISYGYRPNKGAHQAIESVRLNVRKYSWVIDLDIKSFFDTVDHELLYKALSKHVPERWVMMYVRRWLESPTELEEGTMLFNEGKGTPQGGVISPLLANLYLHYSIDKWLQIHYPEVKLVRYADDMILHCRSETEAINLMEVVKQRLSDCCLEAHPEKTKIVYCKKSGRDLKGKSVQFDFLGFSFKPMTKHLRKGGHFLQYDCTVSRKSKGKMLSKLGVLEIGRRTGSKLSKIAEILNKQLRGWINYYGKVYLKGMSPIFYYIHQRLMKWAMRRYKGFKGSRIKAANYLKRVARSYPNLFYHWSLGYSFL